MLATTAKAVRAWARVHTQVRLVASRPEEVWSTRIGSVRVIAIYSDQLILEELGNHYRVLARDDMSEKTVTWYAGLPHLLPLPGRADGGRPIA